MKTVYKNYYIPLILLMVLGLFGCSEDELASFTPQPAFSVAADSDTEALLPVQFTNQSTDAFSYLWSFGDGAVSTEINPSHTYEKPGEYVVTLEANATGQRAVVSQTITISSTSYALYFIDNDALKLKKLALSDSSVTDVFDLPGFCFGLAYDEVNDEIYYTDDDAQTLFKNNFAGTAETAVASGFGGPRDIALNVANNLAYVADRSRDEIVAVDLTTGNTSVVYSVSDDPDFLLPVGLDYYAGNLYMTCIDFGAETVWSGSADGSSLVKIIDFNDGGFGYGLEVDKVNEQLYFDNNDGGTILRANLDGSGIEQAGSATDRVYGIAINNSLNALYWSGRDGEIKGANLDGSNEITIKSIGSDVRGMIIRRNN
ncbi:MAG: PKD domain-containing protein [Flammeovirgaceae bacterium]